MVNNMANKESFKSFIAQNPSFASFVNSGQMTWQKFYEMYDLYGENSDVWTSYRSTPKESTMKINDLIKNVDMNSIKEHINTAQKALDFVQELTSKGSAPTPNAPITPRPLNKFFED